MGIHDVYSKRNKPLPDVYVYDTVPQKLKHQAVYWIEATYPADSYCKFAPLGHVRNSPIVNYFQFVHRAICEEHGLAYLTTSHVKGEARKDIFQYLIIEKYNIDVWLDLLEMFCSDLSRISICTGTGRPYDHNGVGQSYNHRESKIKELNYRYRENGVGYEFNLDANQLIRIDNTLVHQTVIQPVLHLLNDPIYSSANQEFLTAFEDYKRGDFADCILKCCQAQESVMKIICLAKGWTTDPTKPLQDVIAKLTAKPLIDTIVKQASLETYLIEALYATARLRNDYAGHGAGSQPKKNAPEHLARYCINSTASNTLYLVEATK